MKRGHVQHLLCGYIDGTLCLAAIRKVETHLSACSDCAQELARWRSVLHLVSHYAPMSCPIDCAEPVLQTIEARRAARLIGEERDSHPDIRRFFLRPSIRLSLPITRPAVALYLAGVVLVGGALLRWAPIVHHAPRTSQWAAARGDAPHSPGRGTLLSQSYRLAANASLEPAQLPVRAHGPDRLQEAFGRSDSLILAADFVEDD